MQQNINIESQKSKRSSLTSSNIGNNANSELSNQNIQNNQQSFQNIPNKKIIPKPIGIYNFKSNKNDMTSLEKSTTQSGYDENIINLKKKENELKDKINLIKIQENDEINKKQNIINVKQKKKII